MPPKYELFRGGLVLEYHPRGTLSSLFDRVDFATSFQEESKMWPCQAISAVASLHSRSVVHGDIGLHNFLACNDGRIILCDFAGSGMEGILPTVAAGVRYSKPENDQNDYPTEEDDVFALGTVLYELTVHERLSRAKAVEIFIVTCATRNSQTCRQSRYHLVESFTSVGLKRDTKPVMR
ncbi:hypothetical protein PT974_11217 [Cladobotryum mycophilum]|uniref:non-specific serine/threonine protein kinase n=1 Tax=Cladobotryum mycophilum TaxID=491253 RepID=A0ABR0S4L6_9HYPO